MPIAVWLVLVFAVGYVVGREHAKRRATIEREGNPDAPPFVLCDECSEAADVWVRSNSERVS